MEPAKLQIRQTLEDARAFAREYPAGRLSEADTKANFIDPIIAALGWRGIQHVTREFFVQGSQQRIDYLLKEAGKPLVVVEAKAFGVELSEKEASQLVSYCVIKGIEWAALTNGRQLEIFNTHLTPDLTAKRLARLDLLRFDDDQSFEAVFETLWLLSRTSLSNPAIANVWMNNIRLDRLIESELARADSSTIRELTKVARSSGISASAIDVTERVRFFKSGSLPSDKTSQKIESSTNSSNPTSIVPHHDESPGGPKPAGVLASNYSALVTNRREKPLKVRVRVDFGDLIGANLVSVGEKLVLLHGGHVIAEASLGSDGRIIYEGSSYATPSDLVFARLLGRQSLNGWTSWYVVRPEGKRLIDDIRQQYLRQVNSDK